MWIKICANTNLEDALLAAELGADAVGFVFAPSRRQVFPAQAAAIVTHLPNSLEKVGVFPAWSADRIVEAVERAKLSTIQLHGAPDLELVLTLHNWFKGRISIIQVAHWKMEENGQLEQVERQIRVFASVPEIDRVLIDSKVGPAIGGTGITFPWEEAKGLFASRPKIILAGGLDSNNVVQAIGQLKPWGVDVASGVEGSLGKKDPAKLKAFIKAARSATTN